MIPTLVLSCCVFFLFLLPSFLPSFLLFFLSTFLLPFFPSHSLSFILSQTIPSVTHGFPYSTDQAIRTQVLSHPRIKAKLSYKSFSREDTIKQDILHSILSNLNLFFCCIKSPFLYLQYVPGYPELHSWTHNLYGSFYGLWEKYWKLIWAK